MPEENSTTFEEQHNGPGPMQRAMDRHGITPDFLARELKRELRAKKTERMKIKGAVDGGKIRAAGRRLVVTSGVIIDAEAGVFGTGDSVIEWDEVNWGTRQGALDMALKLRGLYPAEKRDVKLNLNRPLTPEEEAYLKEAMATEG